MSFKKPAKNVLLPLLFALGLFWLSQPVKAEEITISGNGSSSQNQATVASNPTATISQGNQAEITNNVSGNSNSGSNQASSNTGGDTKVQTGDTSTATNVLNQANTSQVQSGCCQSPAPSQITVSGNGSGSTNTTSLTDHNTTTVNINQTANITNNVNASGNSGGNTADSNGGNTTIRTGNVLINTHLENKGINNYKKVDVPQNFSEVNISISGNGANSRNTVSVTEDNSVKVSVNNLARLENILNILGSSGGNTASNNLGNVSITTGNVLINTLLKNGPINQGEVNLSCCQPKVTPPPPSPGGGGNPPPANIPPGGSTPGAGAPPLNPSALSSAGQILGATIGTGGAILPATGSEWMIFLTLLSLIMFITGWYLRFHPGNDPGLQLA